MIIRIKGEWGSIGRAPDWLPKWLREKLSWKRTGKFDFQRELDNDEKAEYNLNSDWSIRFEFKEDDIKLELLYRGVVVQTRKHTFKDLEFGFKVDAFGQYAKGTVLFDF